MNLGHKFAIATLLGTSIAASNATLATSFQDLDGTTPAISCSYTHGTRISDEHVDYDEKPYTFIRVPGVSCPMPETSELLKPPSHKTMSPPELEEHTPDCVVEIGSVVFRDD